jgi:DNA-binding NtrC family response regulator
MVTDIDIVVNDASPLPESKGGDNQEIIGALANLTATLSSMQAGGAVKTAVAVEKEEGSVNNGVVLRFNGVPTRNDVMRVYFKEVYDLCGGNMKRVAEAMGISRTTLYTMRSELELEE